MAFDTETVRLIERELRGRRVHTLKRWWSSINSKTMPRDFPVRFDPADFERSIGAMRLLQAELGLRVIQGRIPLRSPADTEGGEG